MGGTPPTSNTPEVGHKCWLVMVHGYNTGAQARGDSKFWAPSQIWSTAEPSKFWEKIGFGISERECHLALGHRPIVIVGIGWPSGKVREQS